MLRLAFIVAFGLVSPCLQGQEPIYSNARWFKVEDGLPQSFISGVQQDKDGFLWIASRDGLARYDGKEFRVFRHRNKDSHSLSSNVITDLFLDAENLLWVFYINERVDCFDPRKMKVCYRDSFKVARKLLADLKIKKFMRDRSGRFWFNANKGIVSYDPVNQKTIWFDSLHRNLQTNVTLGLTEGIDKSIYVFTRKGVERLNLTGGQSGFFVPYDPLLGFHYEPDKTYLVTSLADQRVAISEKNRILIFDPGSRTFVAVDIPSGVMNNSVTIQALHTAKDGNLYVSAGGGVYRLEKNNKLTWLWQSKNENPYANECISFLVDQSSVVWFGTNAGGIAKIDLHALPFKNSPYKINFSTDVLAGLTGEINNIPSFFKEGKWAYTFRSCYDRNNGLWLSYVNNESEKLSPNVYVLTGNKTFSKVLFPSGKFHAIKGLSLSPSGIMNAVDLKGNLWRWTDNNVVPAFYSSPLSLDDRSSVVDLEADEDVYWIATDKQGLFQIQNNRIIKHYSSSINQWPSDQVTDLAKDPNDPGILWVGTLGAGLIRLKKSDGSFKVYTTENELPNNTVYSIVPDKAGDIWISTNNGISKFSSTNIQFNNFDVKDGLPGNEFNRFHHLVFPDDRIAFGGPDGFTIFDPSAYKQDNFQTPVQLTGLRINNKLVEFNEEKLVLPYNQNFLQFEFAALQFNQPEKLRYRYMLKGYDKDWVISDHTIASYTRLPPGSYTLLLNASNTSGNWSPYIKQLGLRIKPPFWATWWAYVIYVSLALLLIRFYWRYRVGRIRMQNQIALEHARAKQLKEIDEIKDRFFANITHELRTPLTLIMTPVEKMMQQGEYNPAILSGVYKNAEQLQRLINELLDISKIEAGHMQVQKKLGSFIELVERCEQQFLMQAKNAGLKLEFVNNTVDGLYLFDVEKWEKIIFNLLSNAIKFTPAGGEVHTELYAGILDEQKTNIRLTVTDTGKGIPSEEIPRLFDRFYMGNNSFTKSQGGTGIGLSLVKELVALMNGTIEVNSEVGKGTSFTVCIPVEKTSFNGTSLPKVADQKDLKASNTENKNEKPLVLIVEDNEELRTFLSDNLSSNWKVLKAHDGKQGWELAIAELPDLIISDLMMPEMNGYELCSKIKEDPRTAHIGFILLTARAAQESRLTGLKKGADEYLVKPFHLDELELRLTNLLEQRNRLRQHFQKLLLPETPVHKLPAINDEFIKKLYEKLDEKIDEPGMSVEILASMVHMSQRTLNRKLKAIVNLTPVEFIRQYRLQKAAILISKGEAITDAAYAVGFETPSYFAQCFKEQFGKTPTEFAGQKTA